MNAHIQSTVASALARSESPLTIQPRKVRFDYSTIDSADFFGNNIVSSAFYTALSITFPAGEAEFIRSVRNFEKSIKDPKLAAEVKDFAAQEAHHGLQHKKLNKQLELVGFAVTEIEALVDEKLNERAIEWSPAKRLRRTVAAEHFTATMAHHALKHPETLDAAPQAFKDLMLWHAIEEIEHKSVAFDVYQHCVGDMRALRRHYLHFACVEFPLQYWLVTRYLLKQGGFKVGWQARKDFFKLLFGKNSVYGSMLGLYWKFMRKDFHPWLHDDSSLVDQWKEELTPHFVST